MLGGNFLSFSKEKPTPVIRDKNKKYILLIEDDSSLAEMYEMKLEREGFVVSVLSDGKESLKAIRDLHPDLVLLDILMPRKGGFDVLKEKARCPLSEIKNIPVIVLTNLASPDDQAEGKRLGAVDWWIKAYYTPGNVAEMIKKFFKDIEKGRE
jgi:two-component system response regulator VicR